MCATCGCSDSGVVVQLFPSDQPDQAGAAHPQAHQHHDHEHHGHADERTVVLEQKVLAKNDRLAELNRDWLRQRAVLAVNLMSSPGAGKTTLLERTAREMAGKMHISQSSRVTRPGRWTPSASVRRAAGWCRSTPGRAATLTPRWWLTDCGCWTRPAARWS